MSDEDLRNISRDVISHPTSGVLMQLASKLRRYGDDDLANWLTFTMGHWTTDAPKKPGAYFIKSRQHELGGLLHVTELENQLVVVSASWHHTRPEDRWRGYWWSEPLPELPVKTPNDKMFEGEQEQARSAPNNCAPQDYECPVHGLVPSPHICGGIGGQIYVPESM